MSYEDFDLPKLRADFGLTIGGPDWLFPDAPPAPLPPSLAAFWADYQALGFAMPSGEARSELLVAPLMAEVWRRSGREIALFSGQELNVDPSCGLNGSCDFLLCRTRNLYQVNPRS